MEPNYDYIDYLVHYDREYDNGYIFYKDCFKSSDGNVVPIVWQGEAHDLHLGSCLGEAVIENRVDGVVAKCHFNETDKGKAVKKLFVKGDELSISIYAIGIQYDNLGYPLTIRKVLRANIKAVIVVPSVGIPKEIVKE